MNRISRILKTVTNNAYIYSVIAKVFGVLTGLIYSILLNRYLGTELRGEVAIINNYTSLLSVFLCLGIYQAYPYYKKVKKRESKGLYNDFINKIFALLLLYYAVIAIPLFFLEIKISIAIGFLLSPIAMSVKQLNYLVLIENPKLRNTTQIKLDIFDILFIACLFFFTKANYNLCVFYLIIQSLVSFSLAFFNLKIKISEIRPSLHGVFTYIQYGIIPMFTVILMQINYNVDVLILENLNISSSQIGIYSIGIMLGQKIWMIPDALKDILISNLAKGKKETEVAMVTRISLAVVFLLILIMAIIGKPLIVLLFGMEYVESYPITIIIFIGVMGMVFYKMVYSYNVVNGRKNINMLYLGIAAILNVIANFCLIPLLGIIGAAYASAFSYVICGICFLLDFCRITNTKMTNMIFINHTDFHTIYNKLKKNSSR